MTRLTPSASMVALVQSALMLPLMLVAVPAGAIADMFDRRKVAMTGLGFASAAGIGLTAIAVLGLTTPWTLLLFCSLIGAGVALRSEEHTSELQSLMGTSYAVLCLQKTNDKENSSEVLQTAKAK